MGRAMVRGLGGWEVWMLPVMYTVFRDLRFLAIQVLSYGNGVDYRRIKSYGRGRRRRFIWKKQRDTSTVLLHPV